MYRISKWVKREFLRVFPALIFFFLSFNLISYTEALMFQSEKEHTFNLLMALVGAGVVAKILLIIDHLPVISVFQKKPLIYDVLWKTLIYSLFALFVRLIPILYRMMHEGKRMIDDSNLFSATEWTRFWAIQIWYIILFFVFSLAREVIHSMGRKEFLHLIFGPKNTSLHRKY